MDKHDETEGVEERDEGEEVLHTRGGADTGSGGTDIQPHRDETSSHLDDEADEAKVVRNRKRGRRSSPLRDPGSLAKLSVAAKAAGLTLEDLVNLVVDSGAVTLPPDGMTMEFTLRDLGLGLYTDLQKQPKPARAAWYGELTKTQQTAVVVTLKDRGYSTMLIGQELDVPQDEVMRTWNKHADNLGAQVVGMRLSTIAGQLYLMGERAQLGASESGDWSLFWRIAKELTKAYADLGIVDRAVHRVEVTHKFDEQKQEEIDQMLKLQDMERKRDEELKKIEVEVYDTAPDLEDYDT